mmetsp:Transcript_30003/g.72044  ORF Transcript_30003/g.72044 Transcript_30003/m.72044 type:complete len:545 (+) Transcript_30003:133-1767(+)
MCLRFDANAKGHMECTADSKNNSNLGQMFPSVPTIALNLLAIVFVMRIFTIDIVARSLSMVSYLLILACFLSLSPHVVTSLMEVYKSIRSRWKDGSLHRSLSRDALKSLSRMKSSAALSTLSKVPSRAAIREFSKSIRTSLSSYTTRRSVKAITGKKFFVRRSYIVKLSIADIVLLYRYASDLNQIDFNKKEFMSDQSQLIRSVITAIDLAVKISRGGISKGPLQVKERKVGDIDALYFVAVTRIFAEWRTTHLSLEGKGYRGYTTSINFSSRDMVQNLSKIEDGVHLYLKKLGSERSDEDATLATPTIRQLLQFEGDSGTHKNLPQLEEKSAASGLLWTKRQICYQVALLRNILNVPSEFPTGEDAGRAAYSEVYAEYHNWALRQVFLRSLGSVPPLEQIFLAFKVPDDDHADDSTTPTLMSQLSEDSGDESKEEGNDENELLMALDNFGKDVAEKWEEFLGLFNCIDDKKEKSHPDNILHLSEESFASIQDENDYDALKPSSPKPLEKAKEAASDFVEEMSPLLGDFESLINQFNMNDPSRV